MEAAVNIERHKKILYDWKSAIESRNINLAVSLDFKHYNELVKPNEDNVIWDKWQNDTYEYRVELQKQFEKILITKSSIIEERFLIVHHNYSGLANEVQLIRNIEFIRNNQKNFNFEIAYLFGGDLKQQEAAIKIYGISRNSIYFLQSKNYIEAGNKLNWLANNKRYSTIIYPSIFPMAYWMSLYVNHGNQKFLQMKYFPRQVGRIKEWGCGRKNDQVIYKYNNENYTQLSLLNPKLIDNNEYFNKNNNFLKGKNSLYFGSISRPEKISNENYNNYILKILEKNSEIIYLYTGREENCKLIPLQVRSHPRSHCLGWVKPENVINQFDIYLEPFPWGGGDMTFLALQTGRPYLILDTPQNRLVGVYGFVNYLSIEQSEITQFSFCDSLETLEHRFYQLVENRELREELGRAWSKVIKNYKPSDLASWIKFLIH